MKSIVSHVATACLLITMACTVTFAKEKKSSIALSADTKVNGVLVKKGMYEVVFDDQSGELSILRGTKLIVKTAIRLEKRAQRARNVEVQTVLEGMEQKLVSISFDGSDQNLVVVHASMQAGSN
jgi:hypothetical protein